MEEKGASPKWQGDMEIWDCHFLVQGQVVKLIPVPDGVTWQCSVLCIRCVFRNQWWFGASQADQGDEKQWACPELRCTNGSLREDVRTQGKEGPPGWTLKVTNNQTPPPPKKSHEIGYNWQEKKRKEMGGEGGEEGEGEEGEGKGTGRGRAAGKKRRKRKVCRKA